MLRLSRREKERGEPWSWYPANSTLQEARSARGRGEALARLETVHTNVRSGDICTVPSEADLKDTLAECLDARARPSDLPKPRVFLLGDSHALNLVPSLTAAVHGKALMRILTATGRGFNSPSGDADHDAFITQQCATSQKGSTARYRKAALAALAANVQKGDVVVIHNKWDEPAPDPHGTADEESDANEEEAAAFYEHEVVERLLAPRGATLLMFSDWTLMDCDKKGHTCALPGKTKNARGQGCWHAHHWVECAAHAKPKEKRNKAFQDLARRQPKTVKFFDLYGLFVDEKTNLISINIPGTNDIWQDASWAPGLNSHMSLAGSFYLWPHLCQLLDGLLR
jgi:hypothetical protein